MQTKVQKWGNSLAVRIPRGLTLSVRLRNGSLVDLSSVKGKLIITPVEETEYTLEQLVAKVNDKNIHREVDTGKAIGRESW